MLSVKRLLSFTGIVLLSFSIIFTNNGGHASAVTNSSSGLSITPRRNLVMKPGQTVSDKLVVSNLSQTSDLNLAIKVIDFTYYNETGIPKLLLGNNAQQTSWSIKPFITIPSSQIVPAGQTVLIPYTIKIPKNQGAGSYYGAIEYSSTPNSAGQVNLNASGVSLMFVFVTGTDHENMTLDKFGAYQSNSNVAGGKYVFISTQKPQQMAFTVTNHGNVAEVPSGSITLNYMFGGKPIVINNVNLNSGLALIQQTRLFTSCINTVKQNVAFGGSTTITNVCGPSNLKPGRYTAKLSVFYGQNGNQTQEIYSRTSFWYLPWWLIITVLVAIAAIVIFVWRLVRRIKNPKHKTVRRK